MVRGSVERRDSKKRREQPDPEGAAAPDPRLPAGRHGLPHEFVAQNQRERIITALADSVARKGYRATTVADITKAASVSRRTFYEHFPGKQECFFAAYEMIAEHILNSMRAAADVFDEWPHKVRAALATMLKFLATEPELARVYAFEPIAAGGEIAARQREAMGGLMELLKAGRPAIETPHPLPEVTEETLVGGIISLIVREIIAGRTENLEDLLPDLVDLTLTPYLGAEEATRFARLGASGPPAAPTQTAAG
jgi:AcrR family transcriptional regulator